MEETKTNKAGERTQAEAGETMLAVVKAHLGGSMENYGANYRQMLIDMDKAREAGKAQEEPSTIVQIGDMAYPVGPRGLT